MKNIRELKLRYVYGELFEIAHDDCMLKTWEKMCNYCQCELDTNWNLLPISDMEFSSLRDGIHPEMESWLDEELKELMSDDVLRTMPKCKLDSAKALIFDIACELNEHR